MKNISLKNIFLFIIVIVPFITIAEETTKINIKNFIEIAANNDTEFQTILIDELFLKYEKTLNIPSKDILLVVQSQYDLLFSGNDGDFENTISLSKLFPYTGTEIKTEYQSTFSPSQRDVNSKLSIYISQSIAENAFGKLTLLKDKIIDLKIDIVKYEIIQSYENYLAKLIQIYYDWFSAYENLKTGLNSYNENLKLLENVKQREKSSIALPIDVNKINLQVLEKEENLMYLQAKFDEYTNSIKDAMKYNSKSEPIPEKIETFNENINDFEKEYSSFKDTSITFKILELLDKKTSIEVERFKEELLPQINIYGGLNITGDDHNFSNSEKYLYTGIYLELPFAKPGEIEKAKYETSKINLEKTKLSSKNFREKLYTHLKNLFLLIQYEKKIIETSKNKIILAEAIVNDETKNYSLGKVSLKDLIDEVNKLEYNKFQKISHEIQLKKLMIEWLNLTDSLIEENNINKINKTIS